MFFLLGGGREQGYVGGWEGRAWRGKGSVSGVLQAKQVPLHQR